MEGFQILENVKLLGAMSVAIGYEDTIALQTIAVAVV